MKLKEGDKAPAFSLQDQDGTTHTLADYTGQWVLLYFYPKDDTPGCTKEACALRDNLPRFGDMKAKVLGISADTVAKHKKFADKYKLPFTLLADVEKKMLEDYGVWGEKKFMGRTFLGINRVSFLVDPKGVIAKVYPKVKPAEHAEEVLEDLKNLTK
jgi:peroxiredoxin Q/BCP